MANGLVVSLDNGAYILDGVPVFVIDKRAYRPVPCRYCGRNIAMVPTKNGKMQPRDADGKVHFVTCPTRNAKAPPPGQLKLF